MAETDSITGKRVIELLRTAQEQNVLLTMQLVGRSFEGLTVITEITKSLRRWVLIIDPQSLRPGILFFYQQTRLAARRTEGETGHLWIALLENLTLFFHP